MTSKQIRQQFLDFFKQRGHTIVPSAPVIPYDDPTLLFTNAGMNQFKDVFLRTGKRDYTRSADSQKCIRVSGKHNDLEEVGRDTYHHTFFEMLGNWSFGDYYKKEAIEWAWELLTQVWKLDKKRLHATVFETDDEAEQLWKTVTDIEHSHIHRFGKKDNFWEMGETGPCGPCSEIHIDLTDDLSGGHLVNAGDARVMEIWNLVFIQYNRDGNGNLTPLPAKHVDTGMGFERVCAVLQNKKSTYETDLFAALIAKISKFAISAELYTGSSEERDIAIRIIADHIRAVVIMLADEVSPSNKGRGYVLRKLIRRVCFYAAKIIFEFEVRPALLHTFVDPVISSLEAHYPELRAHEARIENFLRSEERLAKLIFRKGFNLFSKLVNNKTLSGENAFLLHDTHGFPIYATQLLAQQNEVTIDMQTFDKLMAAQQHSSYAQKL